MSKNAVSLEDFWNIVKRLTREMERCIKALGETPEDDEEGKSFWRRMYALAVFALFDGATYRMTFHAYAARNRRDVIFSMDEMARLEKSYDFDEDQEEAVMTFSKSQMLDDIKFAFNAFARVHYSDYVLPIGDEGWILIQEIAHIRASLQCPREEEELEVYEENVDTLVGGSLWFVERMIDLIESSRESALEKFAAWDSEEDEIIM